MREKDTAICWSFDWVLLTRLSVQENIDIHPLKEVCNYFEVILKDARVAKRRLEEFVRIVTF